MNRFDIPSSLFCTTTPFAPNRVDHFRVIVGKPLDLPRIENPSSQEIEHWHGVYVEKLKCLVRDYGGGEEIFVR